MAQKQKATGIITLSVVSIKICYPLFCLLFKKYLLSIRNRAVCLFVIKMSSLSDFCHENKKSGRFQRNTAN